MPTELDEKFEQEKAERSAERFQKRFREQMDDLEKSPLALVKPIDAFDMVALGQQLEQFEFYHAWCKENGTANDLGKLPALAFDIITASYGASIIPMIASTQPIEEEKGIVYFKNVKALNTRGNVTANQLTKSGNAAPAVYPEGYAGEVVTLSLGNTASADLDYSGTISGGPLRPNTLKIEVVDLGLKAVDDGDGNLMGVGMQGTINYATGAWAIDLLADPAGTYAITGQVGTDFEAGGTLPKIASTNGSTDIEAEIFALGTEMGMFKAFAMQKRFGIVAEDDMVADLTNEITGEIGNTLIARLAAAAQGNTNWSKTHVGYSWTEHLESLKTAITESESVILGNAGRGVVNTLIAGPTAASYLASLKGFKKSPVSASGPQFYGTLDNMTVIRAPQVNTNTIYTLYKGRGMFDAPAVYAPYMPLFVTGSLPVGNNPLLKQGVAAVWAGLKSVIPGFISKVTVTA